MNGTEAKRGIRTREPKEEMKGMMSRLTRTKETETGKEKEEKGREKEIERETGTGSGEERATETMIGKEKTERGKENKTEKGTGIRIGREIGTDIEKEIGTAGIGRETGDINCTLLALTLDCVPKNWRVDQ